MEGLSGQDDWRQFDYGYPDFYAKGRQLLTDDVNATIEDLFAGGATKVDVVDGHGSGNPEPDLLLDKMDQRAQMVYRNRPFDPYIDLQQPNVYDAVALVGMHAKPNSGGFANHTYTWGVDFIMNGMSLSEPEIIGYSWGRVNVPVIYVAGDAKLKTNLDPTMPWIEFVAVKEGTSASTAKLYPLDSVHAEMRAKAKRALENLSRMKTMQIKTPIAAALRALPPNSFAALDSVPGINLKDNTVSFTAADYEQAYRGEVALVSVASMSGRLAMINETLRSQPGGMPMLRAFGEARTNRWFDAQSGRWKAPEVIPQEIQNAGKKFFGDR